MLIDRRSETILIAAALGGAVALEAPRAEACGGTFCDSGPVVMPVDQTGENILFVMDADSTEAHIQIDYQGEASRFAWVIPMPSVPAVEVGSQPLFTNLLAATVPAYVLNWNTESCGSSGGCCGSSDSAAEFGASGGCGSGAGGGSGGPTVVFEQTVGAFDVTVLEGGTAAEVSEWLEDNGYATTDTTPAILDAYVAQSYVFAAVKLTSGAGIDQIHPLVMKYPGTMPCIPLTLTGVAAVDNMTVRAFFLGDARVYPENYALVELNEARINWVNAANNYDVVVSRAVDEAPNGQGFVVEYAGASSAVSTTGVFAESWDIASLATLEPQLVVDALVTAGLASCSSTCSFFHPLLLPLLQEYLPAPAGTDEASWYAQIGERPGDIDAAAWDGPAFADDYAERIVEPGRNATEALGAHPFLTRMLTTISPAEMTLDPTFVVRTDLDEPDVAATRTVNGVIPCEDTEYVNLGELGEVATPNRSWPSFPDDMPWASRVLSVPAAGAPVLIVDNDIAIRNAIGGWNVGIGFDPSDPSGCSMSRRAKTNVAAFFGAAALLALRRRRSRPTR